MKEIIKKHKSIILLCVIVYVSGVTMTQRFKCPKKTETEILMCFPKNLILQFDDC